MGLFTKEQTNYKTRLGKVEEIYCSRLAGRLRSAINQINKKEPFLVPLMVIDLDKGEPIPEENWGTFRQIKTEVLAEFQVESEGRLFWRHQYTEYEDRLKKRTREVLGRGRVNERYWMKGWRVEQMESPAVKDFLTLFGQDILDSYQPGIGIASKEAFKSDLEKMFLLLNEEITLAL